MVMTIFWGPKIFFDNTIVAPRLNGEKNLYLLLCHSKKWNESHRPTFSSPCGCLVHTCPLSGRKTVEMKRNEMNMSLPNILSRLNDCEKTRRPRTCVTKNMSRLMFFTLTPFSGHMDGNRKK